MPSEDDRYRLINFQEALKLDIVDEYERKYSEWCCFIIDTQNNILVGRDGGEPEDQILYRDWKWVVPALNKAYFDGVRDCKVKN